MWSAVRIPNDQSESLGFEPAKVTSRTVATRDDLVACDWTDLRYHLLCEEQMDVLRFTRSQVERLQKSRPERFHPHQMPLLQRELFCP